MPKIGVNMQVKGLYKSFECKFTLDLVLQVKNYIFLSHYIYNTYVLRSRYKISKIFEN